jgi:uncharacterized BrkB/YihY/UPF0761 family membrane protein
VACTSLGLLFVSISTVFHHFVPYLPFQFVRTTTSLAIIRATTTCLFVITIFALYKFLPNKKISAMQVLPAAILAGVMAEVVRIVYVHALPNLAPTQGPFSISVSFLLFVYFETFVVLGCAFLATETERYPWMGFLSRKRSESPVS